MVLCQVTTPILIYNQYFDMTIDKFKVKIITTNLKINY